MLSGFKLKTRDELSNVVISVRVQFGVFEVNLRERELRKFGLRVNLQQKPFQILRRLLETPGEFVSREDLAKVLWPELHVLFDRSLNTAVNALRRALEGGRDRRPRGAAAHADQLQPARAGERRGAERPYDRPPGTRRAA